MTQIFKNYLIAVSIFSSLSCFSQFNENYKVEIIQHSIKCSGTPQEMLGFYSPYTRYGVIPQISISPNADNSYNVAWLDVETGVIKISVVSSNNKLIKEIIPKYIGVTERLCGFTSLPNNRGFVIGYSKNNSHGNKNMEYWITYCNSRGNMIFNKRIFGDKPASSIYSEGHPCYASTARIVYLEENDKIYFYLGHSKRWEDGVKHQGSYIGKLDLKGSLSIIDSWFVSHDFDQRLITNDNDVLLMYHGDGYPRSLGFASVINKYNISKENFFNIAGELGDNDTYSQLGGIVNTNNNQFCIAFSSGQDKPHRELGFLTILPFSGSSKKTTKIKWFKSPMKGNVITPKIANRDKGRILLAYENIADGDIWTKYSKFDKYKRKRIRLGTYFIEVDYEGNPLTKPMKFDDIKLQPMHDMVSLPNGNIIWAVADVPQDNQTHEGNTKQSSNLIIYEINRIENNRRLYDSYDSTYLKDNFSLRKGGFLLIQSNFDLKEKQLIEISRSLAKKGYRVVLEENNKCYINDEIYDYYKLKNLKKSSLAALKKFMRKSGNKIIYFKNEVERRLFKQEIKKLKYLEKWNIKILVSSKDRIHFYNTDDLFK